MKLPPPPPPPSSPSSYTMLMTKKPYRTHLLRLSMNKQMLALALVAALGSVVVTMTTTNILPAVFADTGGDPNESQQADDNLIDRHSDKVQKESDAVSDDNPHNHIGPGRAHTNMHDGTGVDCSHSPDC